MYLEMCVSLGNTTIEKGDTIIALTELLVY